MKNLIDDSMLDGLIGNAKTQEDLFGPGGTLLRN
jgi:hypothetical protein